MRLTLRLLGTWLIGLALIFLVIDGTRSLAAKSFVFTSLQQTWKQLSEPSLEAAFSFFETRYFASFLEATLTAVLGYPCFAVLGILGLFLAILGKKPRRERFLQPDYI